MEKDHYTFILRAHANSSHRKEDGTEKRRTPEEMRAWIKSELLTVIEGKEPEAVIKDLLIFKEEILRLITGLSVFKNPRERMSAVDLLGTVARGPLNDLREVAICTENTVSELIAEQQEKSGVNGTELHSKEATSPTPVEPITPSELPQ